MNRTLPFAERYEHFRQEVFAGLGEQTPLLGWQEPMTELHLQSLWFAGQFGSDFTSTEGQRVHIRDFGVWNAGAGPDFAHCTVLIGGQSFRGDIEIDPDVRDWERHEHGSNPEFDRVVLHVFVDTPSSSEFFTRTSQHQKVAQVQLLPSMLSDDIVRPVGLAPARLGRCALPLRAMKPEAVQSLLEGAAQFRLLKKARRLHQCVAAHGRDQAIYQALAQTLGYQQNQRPFVLLAQRLPLKRLLAEKPIAREALLLGIAGFLEAMPFEAAEVGTREYLRELWQHWWKLRAEFDRWTQQSDSMKWKLKATRPGNHPQRRLGALAAMLRSWNAASKPLKNADAWNRETWSTTIESLQHDFWSTHYTLSAEPAARPVALVGETRVHEMLANVVYPLLVPDQPKLWTEYLDLPALLDNQKTRRAALRLFGDSPLAAEFHKKLHHQQGLIQIYEDFCLEDDSACADCPFPERLAQWC